jgi:ABC-type multidrug transport system permease subunit
MILTILRILYLRLRNNPVELLLVFVMPVAFFSIFAAIFSNGITAGSEKKLRVGWIAQRETTLGDQLKAFLEENSTLECLPLITEPNLSDVVQAGVADAVSDQRVETLIADAQRSGAYDLIVRLPKNFPETISDDPQIDPSAVHLVTDGQNPMALAMVTSVINGFIAQQEAAKAAERLIDSTSFSQYSQQSLRSPSTDVPQTSLLELPEASATQPVSQRWIEPLREPEQICLQGTRFLDRERNPCEPFGVDFSTSGLMVDADRLSTAQGAWQPALESPAARYFEDVDLLQQTLVGAIRFRDPQNSSSRYLRTDSGQPWMAAESLSEFSPESISVREKPIAFTRPAMDDTFANLLETAQIQRPVSVRREALEIRVENPQSALQENPRIAMYAAGIAVLFLLFSSTGNAATLLEEAESGTLDRIMVGKAKVFHIIVGKWLGIFLLGMIQISVMFLWAELIFQIQLWKHLDGFLVMTCCTSAATASLAMLMATLCRSRAQLNAVSVVLILSMSAMGGSMIPRFVMSDRMKEIGQWTFNAWALDGYQKVFWYQSPVSSLLTEVTVLMGSALVMGCLALFFSQRWKCA